MTLGTDETITLDVAKAALEAAIAERGEDYVYPFGQIGTCKYRWEPGDVVDLRLPVDVVGHGSCGVGVVLEKWDILDTVVPKNDDPDGDCDLYFRNTSSFVDLAQDMEIEDDAALLLARFQTCQDMGLPWGQSYRMAVDLLHEEPGVFYSAVEQAKRTLS